MYYTNDENGHASLANERRSNRIGQWPYVFYRFIWVNVFSGVETRYFTEAQDTNTGTCNAA